MKNKKENSNSNLSTFRLINNKQIIKSLNELRRDIKSKDYNKRMDFLLSKSQELVRLGCFNTDAGARVSQLALRLLEKRDPSLTGKPRIEEEDWEANKNLSFKSVQPEPQSRLDKAPTKWVESTMEVKRITDKRGTDSKILVPHPTEKGEQIKTPWYCIPNIVDFEISEKLGQNAALLLINQQLSRAKAEEDLIP